MLFSYYMNHTNVQEERALIQSSGIQADRTSTTLNLHYLEQGVLSLCKKGRKLIENSYYYFIYQPNKDTCHFWLQHTSLSYSCGLSELQRNWEWEEHMDIQLAVNVSDTLSKMQIRSSRRKNNIQWVSLGRGVRSGKEWRQIAHFILYTSKIFVFLK